VTATIRAVTPAHPDGWTVEVDFVGGHLDTDTLVFYRVEDAVAYAEHAGYVWSYAWSTG
jgi:hypothetical protein